MKKVLLIVAGFLVFVLVALGIAPFLFKDKIKAKVDEAIAQNVNAKVYYDINKFGLSFFKNFPNLSLTLGDFGVVNYAPFEGDTLVDVKEFVVVVDIMSAIKGENLIIRKISLNKPYINIQKNLNGVANYDISKPSSDTTTAKPTEKSTSKTSINKWEIINGKVIYDDKVTPTYAEILNLNHSGSGDFSADILDLATQTNIESITVQYDSVSYLKNKKMDVKLVLNMDNVNSKYTFKENSIAINDFAFAFDGWLQMKKDSSIDMDLTYKVKETAFKNLLSLIPGMYTESFKDLESDGSLAFDGFAKGTYFKQKLPAFGVNLIVKDGKFQYPKLPTPVKDVNIDLNVKNKDGIIDNTYINLKNLHFLMGSNPIDAKMIVKGLKSMDLDGQLKAKLNLAEVTQIFPLDSLTLKGTFDLDAKVKGIYKNAKQLPALDVKMAMKDGYVKTLKMPNTPLEQINFSSTVKNATGTMKDMVATLDNYTMLLDGEKFTANAKVENFDDYTYTANVKGNLDMDKITKIYPMKDMTLGGKILTDITTSGKMSVLKAGKYDQLPTSGSMDFNKFSFVSASMPQGLKLTQAHMAFDPQKITVSNMNGFLGKSDFAASGIFSNYMAYLFQSKVLVGKLDFSTQNFDVNEWIPATDPNVPKAEEKAEDPTPIPQNIDFTMNSKLKKVLYTNMTMTDMTGIITMKDGIFKLTNGNFDLIGGHFATNCTYNTQNPKNPKFDYDLDMKNVDIQAAVKTFESIKKFAPIAEKIEGKMSTNFAIKSDLAKGYQPVYNTLFGNGLAITFDAKMKDGGFMNKINSAAKFSSPNSGGNNAVNIGNTRIQFDIANGRIKFKPFDIKIGDNIINMGGSSGLDKTLDFDVVSQMPAATAGAAINDIMSKLGGQNMGISKVLANIKVTGSHDSPKFSLLGITTDKGKPEDMAKNALQEKAKQEGEKLKQQALQKAQEEAAKLIQQQGAEKAKQEAEKLLKNKIKLPF
ncbi:MAG: hypothetical protein EAZ27_05240 [Cytophagales bacterium]|nr:MAG: hypothetical protein EAZ27_05240 [Cytophagales bacterium]